MNSTQQLTSYINNSIPCIFIKYGDGEYYAANFFNGTNCDGTPYTKRLGNSIRESFIYISQQSNAMIGGWHDLSNTAFWNSLSNVPVSWVDYHTVIIDYTRDLPSCNDKLDLYISIKKSTRKKIYVANGGMLRASQIFLIDSFIEIDPSDWFEENYEDILKSVCEEVIDETNTLILTSAGMGAKSLITDLHMKFPGAIYIDIGSAFDMLCSRKNTRSYSPSYEQLCGYLKPMLSE